MADIEELTDATDEDVDAALGDLGDDEGVAPPPVDAGSDPELDALADELAADEPPEEPDDTGQPRGPDGKFLPKDATEAKPSEPIGAPEQGASSSPPVAPEGTPPVDPYATWQPFKFKADGVESVIEGIRANDTHVVIPLDVWNRELAPKHLANREAWQQERGRWQQHRTYLEQQAREAHEARTERELKSEAMLAEFGELMADPRKLAAFFEDFERQAPILQAQMDARAARAERDAFQAQINARAQQEQEAAQAAEREALFVKGSDVFERDVLDMLNDPKYAALKPANDEERDDLLAELWNPQLILITDPQRGELATNREAVAGLLDRRAAFLARRQSQWRQTSQTETRNAAAVASPATSPRTAKPSTPAARAATASPGRSTRPAMAAKNARDDKDAWDDRLRADLLSAFDD